MRKILYVLSLAASLSAVAQSGLTKVWETDTSLTTPEAVLYDSRTKTIYVSCINGAPAAENNGSFIAKISPDGKVIQRKFTDNLNSTKGLAIANNRLYVTELTKLAEIDLKTGKVLKRHDVPDAKFLNDISADEKGNVYFTDMRGNRLWMLQNDKVTQLAADQPLNNPNGLLHEKGRLLVGNGDGKILALDLKTKKFNTLAEGMGGIDGLSPDGKGGYFASEWQGKIWHVAPGGKPTLLHDSSAQKMNTADFDYIPSQRLLLVPTFFTNKVIAYTVK